MRSRRNGLLRVALLGVLLGAAADGNGAMA